MFFIHPIIQLFAIALALYVFYLGFQQFRAAHLKQEATFPWKRHVALGIASLTDLVIGLILGLTVVRISWYGFLVTGTHGKVGLTIVPFLLFGMISGIYMNRVKRKRKVLPLLHGINNSMLIFLALSQIVTGGRVLSQFVLGH